MKDMRTILKEVLTIIEYKEDKEKFVNELTNTILQKALVEAAKLMSEKKRLQLAQIDIDKATLEERERIFGQYIDSKRYMRQVARVSNRVFLSYIDTIVPTLSSEIQNKLQEYLQAQI